MLFILGMICGTLVFNLLVFALIGFVTLKEGLDETEKPRRSHRYSWGNADEEDAEAKIGFTAKL